MNNIYIQKIVKENQELCDKLREKEADRRELQSRYDRLQLQCENMRDELRAKLGRYEKALKNVIDSFKDNSQWPSPYDAKTIAEEALNQSSQDETLKKELCPFCNGDSHFAIKMDKCPEMVRNVTNENDLAFNQSSQDETLKRAEDTVERMGDPIEDLRPTAEECLEWLFNHSRKESLFMIKMDYGYVFKYRDTEKGNYYSIIGESPLEIIRNAITAEKLGGK